jgi:hypothetical protein
MLSEAPLGDLFTALLLKGHFINSGSSFSKVLISVFSWLLVVFEINESRLFVFQGDDSSSLFASCGEDGGDVWDSLPFAKLERSHQ